MSLSLSSNSRASYLLAEESVIKSAIQRIKQLTLDVEVALSNERYSGAVHTIMPNFFYYKM